jgi:formiminotetrahydrofolate cyclodeaminase
MRSQQKRASSPVRSELGSCYRSKFYERTIEQENMKKEMEEAKAELKFLIAKKRKNYSRYVSQVYQPKHSEQKA